MKIEERVRDDVRIVAVSGEVDMHHSPALREKLLDLTERRTSAILIDLGGLQYIDSSGVATFVECLQELGRYGGFLGLFGLPREARDVFEIARLDQVFRFFPDEEAALQAAALPENA